MYVNVFSFFSFPHPCLSSILFSASSSHPPRRIYISWPTCILSLCRLPDSRHAWSSQPLAPPCSLPSPAGWSSLLLPLLPSVHLSSWCASQISALLLALDQFRMSTSLSSKPGVLIPFLCFFTLHSSMHTNARSPQRGVLSKKQLEKLWRRQ